MGLRNNPRNKNKGKKSLKKTFEKISEIHPEISKLRFDIEDLRFSTPYEIAIYRAKRLKCRVIVDACSGLGFQTLAFANECEKVIAIERDKEKIKKAMENAKTLGLDNITFFNGDVLSREIVDEVKYAKPDIIFCDPERIENEKERVLDTIKPNLNEFLEIYSKITKKIAIEVPPFMQNINFDCEKEYIYYNERKHLTLYFNDLKKNEKNAVILPEKTIIEIDKSLNEDKRKMLVEKGRIDRFIYEIKEIVNLAGLIPELVNKLSEMKIRVLEQNKHTFLTSNRIVKSDFFKNKFEVLEIVGNRFEIILDALRRHRAKHVVLRMSLDPKEYWEVRKQFEERLDGDRKLHLFVFGDKAVIAKSLEFEDFTKT